MAVHKVLAIFESIDKISPTAKKIGGNLDKLSGIATKAGLAIAAGLAIGAAATIAFVGDSVKMASEFQDQMAIMGVATKDFGVDIETLRGAALAVGGDTRLIGVSATGAADAITGLAKAGLSSTEVFGDLNAFLNEGAELGGALRASIDLAAASELDMVQASDLAAVALATFGSDLETAEERAQFVNDAMDNMVKAADASVASVSGLADAMKNVGPTAASFGFSLQDTNNALAILSTRGIEGGEAGTALKSMMTNLMRPTDAVTDTLADLNVTLFDSAGNMKSLPTIIGDLEGSMADLTQEQKLANIQTLAGTFGMKAMSTLIGEGVEGWDAMADATENAAGIQEQAAARTATLSGKLEGLEGVFETLQIEIGSAFLPLAEQVVDWAAAMATQHGPALIRMFQVVAGVISIIIGLMVGTVGIDSPFEDFFPPGFDRQAERASVAVRSLIGALGIIKGILTGGELVFPLDIPHDVVVNAMKLGFWLRNTIAVILDNKDAIISAFAAIGRAISAALVAKKVAGIIKLLAMLTTPIGIILALVGVLAFVWKSNFGDIQGKTQAVWKKLKVVFAQIQAWLEKNIPKALKKVESVFAAVWGKIGPTVTAVVNEIVTFAVSMFNVLVAWVQTNMPLIQRVIDKTMLRVQEVITAVLEFVSAFWAQHGESIINTVLTMWEVIKVIIETTINTVLSIITAALQVLDGDWRGGWETIKTTAETVWILIQSAIETALNFIKDTILPAAMTAIQAIMSIAWGAIQAAANAVWTAIQTKIAEVWTAIQAKIAEAITLVKETIINVLDALGIEWQDNWEQIKVAAGIVWDAIRMAVSEAVLALQLAIQVAMLAIQLIFQTAWTAISTSISTTVEAIKTTFGEAMDWLQGKAQAIWDKIVSIFDTGANNAKGVLDGVLPAMKAAGAAIVDAIKQGISDAWGGLIDQVNQGLDALTDLLPGSPVKDPTSPLRKLPSAGKGIVTNLIGGMVSAESMLQNAFRNMLTVPGALGGQGGGAVQLAGAGASSGGGNVDRSTNQTFILNYQGNGGGGSDQDDAAGAMREIEVAAQLRR